MSERPLWAPWRIEYLISPRENECVLCAAARTEGADAGVVERGKTCFTLLNAYPYVSGHLLITPYHHIAELEGLTDVEMLELMVLARRATGALRRQMHPDGFNIGFNLGQAAGAGIPDHLHLHVVPRWEGDTNFMPVIAGTHVISQALKDTQQALIEQLRSEP